jgi:hypothetical protein
MVLVRFQNPDKTVVELDCIDSDGIGDILDRLRSQFSLTGRIELRYRGRELLPAQRFSEVRYNPISPVILRDLDALEASESSDVFDATKNEEDSGDEEESDDEPSDFPVLVESLMDMGFTKDQAESALRESRYDAEHAVALLVTGTIGTDDRSPAAPVAADPDYLAALTSLNETQKEDLAAIQKVIHVDPATVLQVFEACDWNKKAALDCLKSMQ